MATGQMLRPPPRRPFAIVLAIILPALLMEVRPSVAGSVGAPSSPLTEEPVAITGHGGVSLRGLVLRPTDVDERRPGVVLVHGAGPHLADDYRPVAEALASAGIVTLTYDKRTEGYSLFERSYDVLAHDVEAAVAALRREDGVAPDRVGVWGLSEGAWVAPLAASRSADIAFVITVAGTAVPPAQQEAWAKANRLADAGISGSFLTSYPITATRWAVAADLFPQGTHDPLPVLRDVGQPFLAIWGADDRTSPPAENVRLFEQVLGEKPIRSARLAVIEGAGHDGLEADHEGSDVFAPGYIELMTSWILALPDLTPGLTADEPPDQASLSAPIQPLPWWEPPWHGVTLLAALSGMLLLVWTGARRLLGRHGRSRDGVRVAALLFAASAVATVLGTYAYFSYLMAASESALGPVLLGRPLPWLVLQALSWIGIAAAVRIAVAADRPRASGATDRFTTGVATVGAITWIPWTLYWGLLTP